VTAHCETNVVMEPIRKWSFINTDSQSCFLEVFSKQHWSRFASSLQMI